MFIKGLINSVDISPMERNTSNRISKDQVQNKEVTMKNIRCRIVKDEKIMFESPIILSNGDLIKDIDSDNNYEVEGEYKAVGFNVHHRTYKVKKRK